MEKQRMQKTVFDWRHFALYLSGPIDFDPSGGRGWREDWIDGLVDIGFQKNQIFNPCDKPIHAEFDLSNESKLMRDHRRKGEWEALCQTMGQIVHIDLRLVDKSDLILVNIPKMSKCGCQIQTYGTIHEIVVARQQRKPVMLVWEGGKEGCSAWLMWLVGHRNIFNTFEEVQTRLKNISRGKTAYNAKDWLLLDLETESV